MDDQALQSQGNGRKSEEGLGGAQGSGRQARIEARKQLKEGNLEEKDKPKAMTAKEANRRKLAEARKRDAERYGEEYVEVTDEDLI